MKYQQFVKSLFILALVGGITGIFFKIYQYKYYNPLFTESRTPKRFFWISANFMADSIQILRDHHTEIDMVSPTWYGLCENGSISNSYENTNETFAQMQEIISLCTQHKIGLHPLIFKGENIYLRGILENSTKQTIFIQSILEASKKYGFDGINLDFEGVDLDLREEYTQMFQNLKIALGTDFLLSIAAPAKESDSFDTWAGWCDYRALGNIADMFMIMTYDEHGGWTGPGEVASLSWVQRVTAYAVDVISLEKLYIGIPAYGYDWSNDSTWQNWGFGYGFFVDQQTKYGGTTTRTTDGFEVRYEYIDGNGNSHLAYYCDATSVRAKESFLSHYPIGGYCYWHLSSGDPAYFMT
jgi:spore germination protein YaaH